MPDVPAYLSVAQWAAGAGHLVDGLSFHPGYGLLLGPAAAVVDGDGSMLHTAALLANALTAGAVVLIAVRLAVLLRPTASSAAVGLTAAVGAMAALHPSVSAASRIAWPETLLTATVLGIGLCLAAAAPSSERSTPRRAAALLAVAAAAAALSVSLHPRAVVLVPALCAAAATARWVRKAWPSLLLGLSAGG
ncbi:MAG TPA: hypothetical protein DEP66_06770, partial [Acidimicrobiaceae bacterium]|nr:hypothetical protein [Acidimicrobiaceae bacterium]